MSGQRKGLAAWGKGARQGRERVWRRRARRPAPQTAQPATCTRVACAGATISGAGIEKRCKGRRKITPERQHSTAAQAQQGHNALGDIVPLQPQIFVMFPV